MWVFLKDRYALPGFLHHEVCLNKGLHPATSPLMLARYMFLKRKIDASRTAPRIRLWLIARHPHVQTGWVPASKFIRQGGTRTAGASSHHTGFGQGGWGRAHPLSLCSPVSHTKAIICQEWYHHSPSRPHRYSLLALILKKTCKVQFSPVSKALCSVLAHTQGL